MVSTVSSVNVEVKVPEITCLICHCLEDTCHLSNNVQTSGVAMIPKNFIHHVNNGHLGVKKIEFEETTV